MGNTSQALPERNSNYLSHAPEAGFETEGIHYVWSDVFWSEEVREDTVEDTEIYCFDLCYGPDADDRLEDVGNSMVGRLCASYGVGRTGKAFGCTAGTWVNGKLSRNLRIEMRMVK